MILALIWIIESALGLIGSILTYNDTLQIETGMLARDKAAGRRYHPEVIRDLLIMVCQAICLGVGIVAVAIELTKVGTVRSLMGDSATAGLLLIPGLLALFSWIKYRSRRQ